jgi:hypothetical protein
MLRAFFRRDRSAEFTAQFTLAKSRTELNLQNLALGVDNVRHDVWLNERFCESARLLITRLIARMGGVDDLVAERSPSAKAGLLNRLPTGTSAADPADCKLLLTDLLREALHRAKREENPSIDLLARVAVLKFLRVELSAQFALVVERCRERLKQYDSAHIDSARRAQVHERFGKLQAGKRAILRACGEQLFEMLRDVEKQTLVRMRSSIFPSGTRQPEYDLFLNRLAFAEDARDDLLTAEHYCMLGHYERDPDRYSHARELALQLLQQATGCRDHEDLLAMLATPENAHQLLGDEVVQSAVASPRAAALQAWQQMLEQEGALPVIIAAYQVPALAPHYAAFANPQQLKLALTQTAERRRVAALIRERSLDLGPLRQALERLRRCRGVERAKIAQRFMLDLMRYTRDLRRLEVLEQAMERVNLLSGERLRALSSINSTLYDFGLADERRQLEKQVTGHVILKADVRDSTRLTRLLTERGLNPASFFSLNFYDPVTRLLPVFGAEKVFIEGDALILAVLESEANPRLAVTRACLLAAEMLRIVGAYNQQLTEAGLPRLELGLGISYEPTAPLYLVDGRRRIMISPALNEADRLSSCNKRARILLRPPAMFHVHAGMSGDPEKEEEALLCYNVDGIQLSEAAFRKLGSEIALTEHQLSPGSAAAASLFAGMAPLNGTFRRLIVRQGHAARLGGPTSTTSILSYFELCTDPAVEQLIKPRPAAAVAAVAV